ncbi:MAG TPA: sigma-70 family RNA polymerase sigma factor [Chryseosolibacter sp.]|nr:sigma-70 family RNA polymerase sigma factor [Chryseosolibacter sp.]
MERQTMVKAHAPAHVDDHSVEELYEQAFPAVARFVRKRGGSFDEARDIFHDALVIYFERNNTPADSAPEAYVVGIAKHLWFRKFSQRGRATSIEMEKDVAIDTAPSVNTGYLFQVIRLTGRKCLELLQAFYFGGRRADSIARSLGYSNAHSATVQKYKCLEKIRDAVKTKSVSYDDFLE